MTNEVSRLIDAARAVLDHRSQMGAGMLPVHNELALAITAADRQRAALEAATNQQEQPK